MPWPSKCMYCGKKTTTTPTKRRLEAFRLRCQNRTYAEVGAMMGIHRGTAQSLAHSAAHRLSAPDCVAAPEDLRLVSIFYSLCNSPNRWNMKPSVPSRF